MNIYRSACVVGDSACTKPAAFRHKSPPGGFVVGTLKAWLCSYFSTNSSSVKYCRCYMSGCAHFCASHFFRFVSARTPLSCTCCPTDDRIVKWKVVEELDPASVIRLGGTNDWGMNATEYAHHIIRSK